MLSCWSLSPSSAWSRTDSLPIKWSTKAGPRMGEASRGREHLPLSGSTLPIPAAFAGLMYLFVRQKYFVGYLGERTQSTPGYIFGKRIILFLFLMSVAGIFNYYLIFFFGSDFENYIKTITTTISPLLLIP
ncbi:arachidonate 5-lipoxygenase-activating protein isoform X3 [Symphalangus syndactylus]|uniref:arachidonate 5-lipoxygenase-activating protein isoform X3 n=1 Tax=Symphalangus syndactylus TaxID=9590 RepID=UPI003005FFED